MSDTQTTDGIVRGLTFGNAVTGGDFVQIRLARDPAFYVDFDAPEAWEHLKGDPVRVWWVESANPETGLVYRKVLDVQVFDAEES